MIKFKIVEVAPPNLWLRNCTVTEAILHCFMLTHNGRGWRLPIRNDYDDAECEELFITSTLCDTGEFWVADDDTNLQWKHDTFTAIPVRTLT
jgi:hypothetical protein